MSIRFLAILSAMVIAAGVAVATVATNAGLINVYLNIKNGFEETDNFPSKRFNQTTAGFNGFLLTVTVATNKMAVPDITTAGYAIFQNVGTATVYAAVSGQTEAFAKLLTNEISGPMRLATTNISFWTLGTLTGQVKGKVYAE